MKALVKTPAKCPFCSGVLRNDYIPVTATFQYLNLVCDKKIGHSITIRPCKSNQEYVDWISIPLNPSTNIIWYMGIGSVCVNDSEARTTWLPFFLPDLINFRKLIDKIKTYLVFS